MISRLHCTSCTGPRGENLWLPNFDSDRRDVLTASDSSMGNSGGTTDVRMRAHSRNSLYLFLVGSSEPVINNKV
jgi:hypothetical protein